MAVNRGDQISASHIPSYRTMYDEATTWRANQCSSNHVNRTNCGGEYTNNAGVKSHRFADNGPKWTGLNTNNGAQYSYNSANRDHNYPVYNSQHTSHNDYRASARSYA